MRAAPPSLSQQRRRSTSPGGRSRCASGARESPSRRPSPWQGRARGAYAARRSSPASSKRASAVNAQARLYNAAQRSSSLGASSAGRCELWPDQNKQTARSRTQCLGVQKHRLRGALVAERGTGCVDRLRRRARGGGSAQRSAAERNDGARAAGPGRGRGAAQGDRHGCQAQTKLAAETKRGV